MLGLDSELWILNREVALSGRSTVLKGSGSSRQAVAQYDIIIF